METAGVVQDDVLTESWPSYGAVAEYQAWRYLVEESETTAAQPKATSLTQ